MHCWGELKYLVSKFCDPCLIFAVLNSYLIWISFAWNANFSQGWRMSFHWQYLLSLFRLIHQLPILGPTCGQRWITDQILNSSAAIRTKTRAEYKRKSNLPLQCSGITPCDNVIISQVLTNQSYFSFFSYECWGFKTFHISTLSSPHWGGSGGLSFSFIESK